MDLGIPFTTSHPVDDRADLVSLKGVMAQMLARHPGVKLIPGVEHRTGKLIVPVSAKPELLAAAEEIFTKASAVADELTQLIKIGHGPIMLDPIEGVSFKVLPLVILFQADGRAPDVIDDIESAGFVLMEDANGPGRRGHALPLDKGLAADQAYIRLAHLHNQCVLRKRERDARMKEVSVGPRGRKLF